MPNVRGNTATLYGSRILGINPKTYNALSTLEAEAPPSSTLHSLDLLVPILRCMGEALVIVDRACRIVIANDEARRIFHLPEEGPLPSNWGSFTILKPDRKTAVEWGEFPVAQALGGRTTKDWEFVITSPDYPNGVSVSGNTVPLWDESKKQVNGAILIFRDIEAQKLAEKLRIEKEAAVRANELKSRFLANVSHEIRTPLTAITGYAGFLAASPDLSAQKRRGAIDAIVRNGTHLTELIDDVLDIAKVESGEIRLDCKPVDVAEEISSVVDSMRSRLLDTKTEIILNFVTPVPDKISTDPMRLRQILFNIVGNAVKFTEQGYIRITVSYAQQQCSGPARLVITVEDTGCGIDDQVLPRLFSPFCSGYESISRPHGGTGLGLDLALRFAGLLGGDVKLVQTKVGSGSTFRIEVQTDHVEGSRMISCGSRGSGSTLRPSGGLRNERALKGVRVLLVEDNGDIAQLFGEILSMSGAVVERADSGRVAVEMIDSFTYDVVLMDIQLPDIDGYEATRSARNDGYDGPIIALTANALTEERGRCLNAGCNDYCSKPITPEQLVELVHYWALRSR